MNIPKNIIILITCEHGGNKIPDILSGIFDGHQQIIDSHEGWDIGALDTARIIAKETDAVLFYEETSRLVIEQNRSLDNPNLFSRFTQSLPEIRKNMLISTIYAPYHKQVESFIQSNVSNNLVVHFSIHSFTPILNGTTRTTDLGLLFDPSRMMEHAYCTAFISRFSSLHPAITIKKNYPYNGTDDGLTTTLRKQFSGTMYAGIEIEINQKLIDDQDILWKQHQLSIARCIAAIKMNSLYPDVTA